MWPKAYKDYPVDKCLKKERTEPGRGIVGCEMHDLNGWGESYHTVPQRKRKGLIRSLLESLFSTTRNKKNDTER